MKLPAHKTKIVCTIGPASNSEAVLERLMLQGMNVARLNFAHGSLQGHTASGSDGNESVDSVKKLIIQIVM